MKRILVVDDTEEILQLTSEVLRTRQYVIDQASSGEECLAKLNEFDPDMILLDLMMPKMTGWEVLDRLEKEGKKGETKVVAFTVKHPYEKDMKRILGDPGYAYIHKPFSTMELLDQVESIFKGSS